jgi:hypothetical protein
VPRNRMQKRTKPVRDATIWRRRGRKEQGFQYLGMFVVGRWRWRQGRLL